MSALWHPSIAVDGADADADAAKRVMAQLIIVATVLFNFGLCFVNTRVFPIVAGYVVAVELGLIGVSFCLTWDRSKTQYAILLLVGAYLAAVMVMRDEYAPQFARDIIIPVVFFFLGRYFCTVRAADRIVALIAVAALGVACFEWFALDRYLQFFDVIHYYVARGSVTGVDTEILPGLYVSGTRVDQRTLLPFLGDHRASGLFLEPVSVGNFGAIAFAWILLRDLGRPLVFIVKTIVIGSLLVLGDSRFGFNLCIATVALYIVAPYLRPTMLFAAPFVAISGLIIYAGISGMDLASIDNDLAGRLLFAGSLARTLDVWQVFGLQTSDAVMEDAGYVYLMVNLGIMGMAGLWAMFAYAPVLDRQAWRYRTFVMFYIVALLCISTSLFTIKTAALLWFLYGTVNNPNRSADAALV